MKKPKPFTMWAQIDNGKWVWSEWRHIRLTEAQVIEIRNEPFTGYGFFTKLGRKYGVHPNTIENAWKRATWRHL